MLDFCHRMVNFMTLKKEYATEHNKKYTELVGKTAPGKNASMLLSQNVCQPLGNSHVLVLGDADCSGMHGTIASNLLQANCSYVVHDRGGLLYRQYAGYLEHKGYTIRCLNLIEPKKSNRYNPFHYIHSDKDIPVLVNTLLKNTTRPDMVKGDHFWFKAENALLMAVTAYLTQFCAPDKQNFSGIMELLRTVDTSGITSYPLLNTICSSIDMTPLNGIFDALDHDSLAAKWYMDFRFGAGRVMQEVLVSCIFRLQAFESPDIAALTKTDNISLENISNEKTAAFIITPSDRDNLNFLADIMISQIFEQSYDYCRDESKHSQLVLDGDDQVVRVFRAKDETGAKEALKNAKTFLSGVKSAEVICKDDRGWYEASTKDGDIILRRGAKEDAEKELSLVRDGGHISQRKHRLPVKTMFLLDDAAFMGEIPGMGHKIATCRGYNMVIVMGFYTLRQLKARYRYEWTDIAGCCYTLLYTGTEDPETAKWISARIGKTGYKLYGLDENERKIFQLITRGKEPVWDKTIQRKAPVNITGCTYTPAQLQQLPADECIVLQWHMPLFRDLKCRPERHPAYSFAKTLAPFEFLPGKSDAEDKYDTV